MNIIDKFINKRIEAFVAQKPEKKIGKGQARIDEKNLDRISKDIAAWRTAQQDAEDFTYPERIALMQIYKDVLDDAQVYSGIQIRVNKATSGHFAIYKDGEIDEKISAKFTDNKGFPLPWFRRFLIIAEWSKFYGNELVNLGRIEKGTFVGVEKIPEENLIPQWEGFTFDYELNCLNVNDDGTGGVNFMRHDNKDVVNWLIPVGDKKDLGLLNKVTPYMIWKEVFGSWSMHADLFGQPLRIGKTDIADPEMKQNMLDMLANLNQGAYAAIGYEDIIELLQEQKGDPYSIYEKLIKVCDEAISKLLLGGTMITDSGSSRSQSEVHERGLDSIIFADKIDLQTVVNEKLIPRMQILGLIPEGDYAGVWDMDETLSIGEWADVFQKLGLAGFKPTKEEVENKIGLELDDIPEPVIPEPPIKKEEKTTEMNNVMNLYKDFLNE